LQQIGSQALSNVFKIQMQNQALEMRLKGETILRETHLAKDIEHELEILRTNTVDAARRAVGLN